MDENRTPEMTAGIPGRGVWLRPTVVSVFSAAMALFGDPARASIIGDAAFFDTIPSTLIDFETDGFGNPIDLIPGQTMLIPINAYVTQGVSFGSGPYWVNDGNSVFQTALEIGGSPRIAIPSSLVNQFEVVFNAGTQVRAVGFWVVNNRTADPIGPLFTAYNAQNQVVGTSQFGGALVDGTASNSNTTADYGFMGIATTEDIARVVITKQAALLDDLRFSPIPGPGGLVLLGLCGLASVRRRR